MDAHCLCRIEDVPDGGALAVGQSGTEAGVVVVRRGERVWAYRNRCPHFSVPLDFDPGLVITYEAQVIMCAHHSALFRFEDGLCIDGPCAGACLDAVAVKLADGKVMRSDVA